MRILSISPNYSQNNDVNFGRFADKNARRVVKKALTASEEEDYMQPVYDSWFERIAKCSYFIAYTDKKSGKVKGKFDDKFVKSADEKVTRRINFLKRQGQLKNLGKLSNAKEIASDLEDIDDILKGVNLSEKMRSDGSSGGTQNYASMRAEEEAYR